LFHLHFDFADAVGFVPMNFGLRDIAIIELDQGNSFLFSPIAVAVSLPQLGEFPDTMIFGNRFYLCDGTDYLHFVVWHEKRNASFAIDAVRSSPHPWYVLSRVFPREDASQRTDE
jgi:hypothetical protein